MRLSSLANDFVIQIDDVDLSKPLEDELFNMIRELWMEKPGRRLSQTDIRRRSAHQIYRAVWHAIRACAVQSPENI